MIPPNEAEKEYEKCLMVHEEEIQQEINQQQDTNYRPTESGFLIARRKNKIMKRRPT